MEDRFLFALFKSERRVFVLERVFLGERAGGVLRTLAGNPPLDVAVFELLAETSERIFTLKDKCNSYWLRKLAGRWFGRPIYVLGEYCLFSEGADCVNIIMSMTRGYYYDLLYIDITLPALMAVRDALMCTGSQAPMEKLDRELAVSVNEVGAYRLYSGVDPCSIDEFYCDEALRQVVYVGK